VDASDAVPDAALASLLDDELGFDATTAGRLSNHLPMALVALHRLGASDDRLARFAELYRPRLLPLASAPALGTFQAWLGARGHADAYAPVRAYLVARIDDDGIEVVVRRHLPFLVDGLSGAAFHGIIRLAYALESASPSRVAAGLAYLTQVHQLLGARGHGPTVTDEPLDAFRRLSQDAGLLSVVADGNIGEQMRAVSEHPSFDGVVDWLAVTTDTPRRLTDAAVALYAATDDFIALHGVTASHAIAVVSPYVDDAGQLSSWWFQALAAAYVTIGAPGLDDPGASLRPWLEHPASWEEVTGAATASDDEHVVKLVYSARELEARSADPLLLAAAARQAGIAPAVASGRDSA
jgi:hypothetical protein